MNECLYNPYALTGKRILITGASSGIGRACAIECSKLGARVILVARRKDELLKTLEVLEGSDHQVEPFDLSGGENIVQWIRDVAQRTGLIDGVVHSAGLVATLPIRATDEVLYRRLMTVNLDAAYWLAKGFRHKSVRKEKASMVFISSVSGVVGNAGLTAYSASKGALLALSKSLALELAKEGIRVNTVAAGLVVTEMYETMNANFSADQLKAVEQKQPLGLGGALDVAWAISYLLSDAARWITGSTLMVDGGYTAA